MTESLLDSVVVGARDAADASVIWLHGLGADGHDFEPIVPELGLPREARVRFVFPHAPTRPVSVNAGMSMPAWYDIYGLGEEFEQDDAGLRESQRDVAALIAREQARGVPSERIVLAGFSQGGAVALHTGLRFDKHLAGILALSTYLPVHETLTAERSQANRHVPLFMAHGTQDPVLPYELGARSKALLESHGHTVEWHEYAMEHAVCPEEIRAVGGWLRRVLAL